MRDGKVKAKSVG